MTSPLPFIETLRRARGSRVAVLHEFWTQYDPRQNRVHAFFEAHEDAAFFGPHIERRLPDGFRLVTYRCDGKPRVFEAFSEITRRLPNVQLALFFVDKDLDDVLGTPWPTDPRIFVTDVYSIENYFVTRAVLERLYRASVRVTRVTFEPEVILAQFETELRKFHSQILSVMAWVLVVRRAGGRPNLANVDLSAMWSFPSGGSCRALLGRRLKVLATVAGVALPRGSGRRLRDAIAELKRVPAKRVVRGKFEAWFFVQFWQGLGQQLRVLAKEGGGNVRILIDVTQRSFLTALASYLETPQSLDLFLQAHLAPRQPSTGMSPTAMPKNLWQRIAAWFSGSAARSPTRQT